jgi:glycosyltransferase involved in cell wall biosynthesis
MEIAMIYNYDPLTPEMGGGRTYVENLVNFLMRQGIDVKLFGVNKSNNSNEEYRKLEFSFIPVTKRTLLNRGDVGAWWKYLLKLFLVAPSQKLSVDVIIHSHRTYFMLPFILFRPENPKVCTLHMKPLEFVKIEFPQYFRYIDGIHKNIEGYCLKRMNIVIAINEEVKRAYIERYPFLENKIRIVSGSGVDLDKFKPLDQISVRKELELSSINAIILFVGRIETIKNIHLLINSFALLNEKIQPTRLVIVGRGSERGNLEGLVKSLDLGDKVKFIGEISPREMHKAYNCADVLALTSYSESSPTVVREALACGIPVVTTNVGDVNDILDDYCGIIVNKNDPKEFQLALTEMLSRVRNDPGLMKRRCRSLAIEKFGFAAIGDQILDLYSKCLY